MCKTHYLFFGSISYNGASDPSGLQEWAVEKALKDTYIVEPDTTFMNFGPPPSFLKCLFPCIMTPFIGAYVFLLIAPWLIF
jgi:hypothetical protein